MCQMGHETLFTNCQRFLDCKTVAVRLNMAHHYFIMHNSVVIYLENTFSVGHML